MTYLHAGSKILVRRTIAEESRTNPWCQPAPEEWCVTTLG
jgi:hypothetical protein